MTASQQSLFKCVATLPSKISDTFSFSGQQTGFSATLYTTYAPPTGLNMQKSPFYFRSN